MNCQFELNRFWEPFLRRLNCEYFGDFLWNLKVRVCAFVYARVLNSLFFLTLRFPSTVIFFPHKVFLYKYIYCCAFVRWLAILSEGSRERSRKRKGRRKTGSQVRSTNIDLYIYILYIYLDVKLRVYPHHHLDCASNDEYISSRETRLEWSRSAAVRSDMVHRFTVSDRWVAPFYIFLYTICNNPLHSPSFLFSISSPCIPYFFPLFSYTISSGYSEVL